MFWVLHKRAKLTKGVTSPPFISKPQNDLHPGDHRQDLRRRARRRHQDDHRTLVGLPRDGRHAPHNPDARSPLHGVRREVRPERRVQGDSARTRRRVQRHVRRARVPSPRRRVHVRRLAVRVQALRDRRARRLLRALRRAPPRRSVEREGLRHHRADQGCRARGPYVRRGQRRDRDARAHERRQARRYRAPRRVQQHARAGQPLRARIRQLVYRDEAPRDGVRASPRRAVVGRRCRHRHRHRRQGDVRDHA